MVNNLLALRLLGMMFGSMQEGCHPGAETSAAITHLMVPGREQGRCRWLRRLQKSRAFFLL